MISSDVAPLVDLTKTDTVYTADQRFRYASTVALSGRKDGPVLVAVHGSARDYLATRDAFDGFAQKTGTHIFAPLFSGGLTNPDYSDGYKFLSEPGIDYPALLEGMLSDFCTRNSLAPKKTYLFGFSGGAQFILRYAYVAASHYAGLIVAAPGTVTLLDNDLPWWPGIAGIEAALGRPLDMTGLAGIPIQLIVGAQDSTQGLVERAPDHPNYSEFEQVAGLSRQQRIKALKLSMEAAGLQPSLDVLDGVGHELEPIARSAIGTISNWL